MENFKIFTLIFILGFLTLGCGGTTEFPSPLAAEVQQQGFIGSPGQLADFPRGTGSWTITSDTLNNGFPFQLPSSLTQYNRVSASEGVTGAITLSFSSAAVNDPNIPSSISFNITLFPRPSSGVTIQKPFSSSAFLSILNDSGTAISSIFAFSNPTSGDTFTVNLTLTSLTQTQIKGTFQKLRGEDSREKNYVQFTNGSFSAPIQ